MWNEFKAAFLEHPVKFTAGYIAGWMFSTSGWFVHTTAVLVAYTTAHVLIRLAKRMFAHD